MPILLSAVLALTQLAQLTSPSGPAQYDPEIEALLRRRDEARKAGQRQLAPAPAPASVQPERDDLTGAVPPAIAARLADCLAKANVKAEDGIAAAQAWAGEGGGAYAAQCQGYALGQAKRWAEAADIFERGAATVGIDAVTRARLFSQAGNAALIAGNAARAVRDLDEALARPLPATLATGEIHLDRARARVASGDMPGARVDLDKAIVLAQADPLAWLLSGTLARRMDDLPLARLHIEEAAKRGRDDAAIALEQGLIYALSGDRDDSARAAFKRAQELAAADSDIAKQAADYLGQLGPEPAKAAVPGRETGR
jgi:tetratricopeptide (TPR) repeat protein